MSGFVDVHLHLTHAQYDHDRDAVVERARAAGLRALVVNGLEADSNRAVLALAERYKGLVQPALGMYPTSALDPEKLTQVRAGVWEELAFIRQKALAGELSAIGECGLDAYLVDTTSLPAQEKVFEALLAVGQEARLPVIIHSRKCERRVMDLVAAFGYGKVVFHCFSGRTRLAVEGAKAHGWCFSIPANAGRHGGFTKMLQELPEEAILTETDAPYLAPTVGTRNEPTSVVGTVSLLARLRGWSEEKAKEQVWQNYRRVFGEG